jgi:hypothetical protein
MRLFGELARVFSTPPFAKVQILVLRSDGLCACSEGNEHQPKNGESSSPYCHEEQDTVRPSADGVLILLRAADLEDYPTEKQP